MKQQLVGIFVIRYHVVFPVEILRQHHPHSAATRLTLTTHGDGSGGHREGMTTNASDGPSGASGDAVHEPAEVGDGGRSAAGHAQHEVELHGSSRGLTLLGHVEDGV